MDSDELKKFLNGKASAEGEKIFNRWYDSFPDVQQSSSGDVPSFQKDIDAIKRGNSPRRKIIQWTSVWMKVAAVVLPLIIAAVILYSNRARISNLTGRSAYIMHSVPAGQRTQVALSDGTIVWLNAGSSLRYPKEFKGDSREIYLTGEAFFDVAHDAEKPFFVHTKNLAVRVLGTSFNVQAYPDRDKEEVTVVTGKVKVTELTSSQSKSINLIPGQRATYRSIKDAPVMSVQNNLPTARVALWRESKLVFDGMSLQDIVLTLEQHYAVSVRLGDSTLSDQRISAEFVEVLPLEKVLDLLSVTLNSCYRKEGQGYVLGGEACDDVKRE